jgi:hypothetical protein
MERKLAAILAADVVGYATRMERDEIGTHEFNSVVDAVECAGVELARPTLSGVARIPATDGPRPRRR